jgi:hypothetical protein
VVAFSASIVLLLIAIVASALRGKHFVNGDQGDDPGVPHHQSTMEAMAREGAAIDYPNVPEADTEYEKALHGRAPSRS